MTRIALAALAIVAAIVALRHRDRIPMPPMPDDLDWLAEFR